MWAEFPQSDVLQAHAALLWRSSSLCCPLSRHLHSLHSCLRKFQEQLALSLFVGLRLPSSIQTAVALLPGDKKESKLGRWREKEKEGPTKGGWKGRWDQREGQASRGDEVCLGCFEFLGLLCNPKNSLFMCCQMKEKVLHHFKGNFYLKFLKNILRLMQQSKSSSSSLDDKKQY